ncbi:MAG: hypothetical protein ABIQ40_13460 [Bacteroidia bacterium]
MGIIRKEQVIAGTGMLNKNYLPLITTLVCLINGALIGLWFGISGDTLFSISILPGLTMGICFYLIHKRHFPFQKRSTLLIFFVSYFVAFIIPGYTIMPFFIHNMDAVEIISNCIKGLTGTGLILLLFQGMLNISFNTFYIFILLLLGMGLGALFSSHLIPDVFDGDYGLIPGFAIWQGIMGGTLSLGVIYFQVKK